ncbi:MAG: hypothetical protein HKN70_12855 [Gammaproteobacteria bacterium]|nr:hypothetical protein [Gammaproteobacteria bacterium]
MHQSLFDLDRLNRFALTNHNAVSDGNHALVNAMEQLTMEKGQFDHAAHVQLAWTYLRMHPPQQALGECSRTIKAFAEHVGVTDKYHATITLANFLSVAISMEEADNTEIWPAFVRRNTELLRHPMQAVYRLYTHECLESDEARQEFLDPDGVQGF